MHANTSPTVRHSASSPSSAAMHCRIIAGAGALFALLAGCSASAPAAGEASEQASQHKYNDKYSHDGLKYSYNPRYRRQLRSSFCSGGCDKGKLASSSTSCACQVTGSSCSSGCTWGASYTTTNYCSSCPGGKYKDTCSGSFCSNCPAGKALSSSGAQHITAVFDLAASLTPC